MKFIFFSLILTSLNGFSASNLPESKIATDAQAKDLQPVNPVKPGLSTDKIGKCGTGRYVIDNGNCGCAGSRFVRGGGDTCKAATREDRF